MQIKIHKQEKITSESKFEIGYVQLLEMLQVQVELLNQEGVKEISIYVKVPGGGDWSNTKSRSQGTSDSDNC